MQPQELTPTPEPQLRGLTESEVAARSSQGLTNALPVKTSRTYVQIIGENVFTPINNILFVLGLALVLLGQVSDAVVSVTVVLLNVMVSVIQEVRAKRMLDQIALLNRPTTMVIRDGQQRTIVPEDVVVGDVLQVRPGDQIVVDGPILQTQRIDVDESLLTGESDLVPKQKGDQLYSGSFCVNGSALYQAEKIGAQSVAYGLTAGARAFRRIYTPLQREINLVIRVLLLFALFFELLLLLGALARQLPTVETLRMAVVIIGLVPNGLFLSISLAYALGAVRISGQGALVLLQSGQFVAPVKTAQDAQTTLTIFALFCGIALLLFVEPPTPFWVGGNELRGDKRIVYLALAMCIVSVLLISLSPLRSLFDLALLDWPDFLVIAVYVVIWVFLVRWAWRGHILERFLALG